MTPAEATAMLRRQLAAHGQDVVLQRIIQGAGGQQIKYRVDARAFVRGYQPAELVGGILQGDSKVVLSAAEIEQQGWPGPAASTPLSTPPVITPSEQDRRVPRKDDDIKIQGKWRNIEVAVPIYLDGELVRIELTARG
jgi:hypothetical protein